MRRSRWIVVALMVAALAAAPALASGRAQAARPVAVTWSHPASVLAVPKFIFHAGLAFGAFHHFIYLPYRAGKFTSGGILSKLKTYIEATGAALFVYHETKLALADAQQNRALKLLVSPLTAVVGLFDAIVSKIKAHGLDASTVTSAQSSVTTIEAHAKSSGSPITEAIPTAKQILAGSV
jgi:hypothetical protein